MAVGRGGRCRRALRRFTLGSGVLKRRTDRVQLGARVALVLAVVLAPVAAALAVAATTGRLSALAVEQRAERHLVDAVLAADADRLTAPTAQNAAPVLVPVAVTWRTADGTVREGTVFAAAGTRTGTSVPVWLGPGGHPVAPPLTPEQVDGQSMASGVLVLLAVPLAAWALYAALVVVLDAHRGHRWAEEWATVEPRWRTHLW